MRRIELFSDKDMDELVNIVYNRCIDEDCDVCPRRNEVEEEICMNDIIRDLWRKWKNAVDERDALVDAVPVVRCKDCKRRGTNDCPMHIKGTPADEEFLSKVDNDFCSYGERKVVVNE